MPDDEGRAPELAQPEVSRFLADFAELMLAGSAEGVHLVRDAIIGAGSCYGVQARLLLLADQLLLAVTEDGFTTTQVIKAAPGLSLDRIENAKVLGNRIREGMPLEQAREQLEGIRTAPPPYPWWLRVIGVVLFSAGFAPSVVPTGSEVIIAVALGLVIGTLFVTATGRYWEPLLPLAGSFVIGCLTLTVFYGTAAKVGPVLLMIPALFVVIPGDYLSAAVGELAVGRISAGSARLVWAVFLLAQLIVGVELAAQVTGKGRTSLYAGSAPGTLPFWVIVLAWIPFSLGLAWAFNASVRNVPLIAVLVVGTFLVYSGVAAVGGDLLATLLAGAAAGAASALLARSPRRPPRLELSLGPFFTLTVGSLGLRGVTELISGDVITGAHDLAAFVLIFPTVAFGLLAGFLLAAPGDS